MVVVEEVAACEGRHALGTTRRLKTERPPLAPTAPETPMPGLLTVPPGLAPPKPVAGRLAGGEASAEGVSAAARLIAEPPLLAPGRGSDALGAGCAANGSRSREVTLLLMPPPPPPPPPPLPPSLCRAVDRGLPGVSARVFTLAPLARVEAREEKVPLVSR
jgi:hypothetical protein